MAKLKVNQVRRYICETCHGNGYIRVATGDTSIDFRDNSQVHQCWDCDSEGEYYETVDIAMVPNDSDDSGSVH